MTASAGRRGGFEATSASEERFCTAPRGRVWIGAGEKAALGVTRYADMAMTAVHAPMDRMASKMRWGTKGTCEAAVYWCVSPGRSVAEADERKRDSGWRLPWSVWKAESSGTRRVRIASALVPTEI